MDYREKDARVGWYKYMFKLGPYWVQGSVMVTQGPAIGSVHCWLQWSWFESKLWTLFSIRLASIKLCVFLELFLAFFNYYFKTSKTCKFSLQNPFFEQLITVFWGLLCFVQKLLSTRNCFFFLANFKKSPLWKVCCFERFSVFQW